MNSHYQNIYCSYCIPTQTRTKMSFCVVDIQGFYSRGKTEFIAKELAVSSGNSALLGHFVFRPPVNTCVDETSQWYVEKYIHGIPWDTGYIPYSELQSLLENILQKYTAVYVKGVQKKVFLEKYIQNVMIWNMDDLGCPNLASLQISFPTKTYCMYHDLNNMKCALRNVKLLKKWLNNNSYS